MTGVSHGCISLLHAILQDPSRNNSATEWEPDVVTGSLAVQINSGGEQAAQTAASAAF